MNFLKKFLPIGFLFIIAPFISPLKAEPVNWRFHLGGMSSIRQWIPEDDEPGNKFTLMIGAEIQIPIKSKFFIETGLNFRWGQYTYTYWMYNDPGSVAAYIPLKDFDSYGQYTGSDAPIKYLPAGISYGTMGFFDIPIRFGYKLKLNSENEFQFAVGPYMSFESSNPEVENRSYEGIYTLSEHNCFSVGLSPSVVYKHRALSLGLYYQNPIFYNGPKNRVTNVLMFTIGVNFNGRKVNMDGLLSGLEIASSALGAASSVASSYYGATGGNSYSSDSYNSGSSSSYSSSNSSSSSSSSNNSSYNRQARNNDYNTYFKYETTVIKIINGDDTVNRKSDIQQKMRSLREKWTKRGDGWNPSPYETK